MEDDLHKKLYAGSLYVDQDYLKTRGPLKTMIGHLRNPDYFRECFPLLCENEQLMNENRLFLPTKADYNPKCFKDFPSPAQLRETIF